MRYRFPPLGDLPISLNYRGTIGLYGGSFNPPHAGHRLVVMTALKKLRLDKIFCLVSPGNPLKNLQNLMPLEQRLLLCKALMGRDRRISVSCLENEIKTHYSIDLILFLKKHFPFAHFIWIMGADNLVHFHRWHKWREITHHVSLAVVDRPNQNIKSFHSVAARHLVKKRLKERESFMLKTKKEPHWVFLSCRRSPLSSTQLRIKA